MKLARTQTYFFAWLIYLTFIFTLFPQLKVTVMLFSIPLAMLGGWLFRYWGALLTTIATIPIHFTLLSVYSDDLVLTYEAFNPFGISSQLIFSCCTALLRSSQIKYKKLNNSLKDIVAERTRDLEELTNYLIEAQQYEKRELDASLLEKPYQELKKMLASSQLLKQKLSAKNHPRTSDAENISMIISSCIKQLRSIDGYPLSSAPLTGKISDSIASLIQQVENVTNTKIQWLESPEWNNLSTEITSHLSEIIFEAVSNALRHADSKFIRIGIEKDAMETVVFVENDGRPFPSNMHEGMGVPLMRYRAGKIGATFAIEQIHTNLARLTCTIPANT